MQNELIIVTDYCDKCHIDPSFIDILEDWDLIATQMEYERQKGKAEGFAEGKAEGEATGFAKGKAEGIAEGFAKGIAEGEAKLRLKNARGMKAAGIAPDLIAQITGLPLETVEGL